MVARRGCLIVLASVAVLAVFAAAFAYSALDPDALRPLVERQLTTLFGAPVTIGHLRISVFPAPAVAGTDVRVGAGQAARAPAVTIRSIRILPEWRTLLSKPVVVDTVEIDGLMVAVRRDRDRRLILPVPAGSAGSSAPASGSASPSAAGPSAGPAAVDVRAVRLRDGRFVVQDDVLRTREGSSEVAAINHIEADVSQGSGGVTVLSLRGALGTSPLTGTIETGPQGLSGSLQSSSLRNDDLPALLALLGSATPPELAIGGQAPMDIKVHVARDDGALAATGRLRAGMVRVGTLAVTDVIVPFRAADDAVVVEPLEFAAYRGHHRGRLGVRYTSVPLAWTLDSQLDGVDVNAFLSANTTARDRLLGTGRVVARLRGTAETPMDRHVAGSANVALRDGVIRNFPLLAQVNRALGIAGGAGDDTRFERLAATLQIGQGVIRTDNASLLAGEMRAAAAGTLDLDGAIAMKGTAVFSREASARMIARVKQISGAKNAEGEVEVPFGIGGTVDQPSFSIDVQQILGHALEKELQRNLRKGFDRLFKKH